MKRRGLGRDEVPQETGRGPRPTGSGSDTPGRGGTSRKALRDRGAQQANSTDVLFSFFRWWGQVCILSNVLSKIRTESVRFDKL